MSTALEFRTLEMILDLLNLPRELFKGRSLTTGATASNILGLGMLLQSLFPVFLIPHYPRQLVRGTMSYEKH